MQSGWVLGAARLLVSLVSPDLAAGKPVLWGDVEGPGTALWALYPTRCVARQCARVGVPEYLREAFPQGTPDELARSSQRMKFGRLRRERRRRPVDANLRRPELVTMRSEAIDGPTDPTGPDPGRNVRHRRVTPYHRGSRSRSAMAHGASTGLSVQDGRADEHPIKTCLVLMMASCRSYRRRRHAEEAADKSTYSNRNPPCSRTVARTDASDGDQAETRSSFIAVTSAGSRLIAVSLKRACWCARSAPINGVLSFQRLLQGVDAAGRVTYDEFSSVEIASLLGRANQRGHRHVRARWPFSWARP